MNRLMLLVTGITIFSLASTVLAQVSYSNACTLSDINQSGWININVLVILAAVMIGSLVYTFASFLPANPRERLRGAVKVEVAQALLGIFIIMALVVFAATTCQVGIGLTKSATATSGVVYSDPMQFAQVYVGDLLYQKSSQLFGDMYAESAVFLLWGNIEEYVVTGFDLPITAASELELSSNVVGVYYGYSGVLTATYAGLLVITFAVLFVIWTILPLVEAFALTAVLPAAIILRTLPFGGQRLREAADSFLAIAIAFFFILPITIAMNSYIINWIYCSGNPSAGTGPLTVTEGCNPYAAFTGTNQLATLQTNTFFSQTEVNVGPNSYFGASSGIANGGQVTFPFFYGVSDGLAGLGPFFSSGIRTFFEMPYVIDNFGVLIAQYMFESIVLIALDIAITIGFAQGLSKGLGAMSTIIGTGPFWGNV